MTGRPVFILNQNILFSSDMTGTSLSTVVDIAEASGFAIQANWTAGSTPVGTLTIQGSTDNVTFATVGSTVSVSGNSGTSLTNFAAQHYRYVRVQYVGESGSGTLNVIINAKLI